jgi:hypothetical protein
LFAAIDIAGTAAVSRGWARYARRTASPLPGRRADAGERDLAATRIEKDRSSHRGAWLQVEPGHGSFLTLA